MPPVQNKKIDIPSEWIDAKKHLARKMLADSKENLIKLIAKYKKAHQDPNLRKLSAQSIKETIIVAKYILCRRDDVKVSEIDGIVSYYEATGNVVF